MDRAELTKRDARKSRTFENVADLSQKELGKFGVLESVAMYKQPRAPRRID